MINNACGHHIGLTLPPFPAPWIQSLALPQTQTFVATSCHNNHIASEIVHKINTIITLITKIHQTPLKHNIQNMHIETIDDRENNSHKKMWSPPGAWWLIQLTIRDPRNSKSQLHKTQRSIHQPQNNNKGYMNQPPYTKNAHKTYNSTHIHDPCGHIIHCINHQRWPTIAHNQNLQATTSLTLLILKCQ